MDSRMRVMEKLITEVDFAEVRVSISLPKMTNTVTYVMKLDDRMLEDLKPPPDMKTVRKELPGVSDQVAHMWFDLRREEAIRRNEVVGMLSTKIAWALVRTLEDQTK